jgi:hypothetical protein
VFEVIPDDSYRFIGTARLPVAVRLEKEGDEPEGRAP